MSHGVVIDANILQAWYSDYTNDQTGPGSTYEFVEMVARCFGFAIDQAGRIEGEWLSKVGKQVVIRIWFEDQIKEGRIHRVLSFMDKKTEKVVCEEYGFPKRDKDIVYLRCANRTDNRHLVSNDIHFYEPKSAGSGQIKRDRIMRNREGSLCRYLQRQLGVYVCNPQYFDSCFR